MTSTPTRRNAWADVPVESESQLNEPCYKRDAALPDACSTISVSSHSHSESGGAGSGDTTPSTKKKLKNVAMSRQQLLLQNARNATMVPSHEALSAPFLWQSGSQPWNRGDVDDVCSVSESGSLLSNSYSQSGSATESSTSSSLQPPGVQRRPLNCDDCDLQGLPSVGSVLHEAGTCKPCLFMHTKIGCQNGETCEFCHFRHKRSGKARPCKGKRERYRKLVERATGGSNGEGSSVSTTPSGEGSNKS